MAKLILRDASITVDGVDLSDHARSVTINSEFPEVDVTGFGADYTENDLGLGTASIEIEFLQDFDAASVDATLWPLHSGKTAFDVVVKPTSAAVSATNPSYTMTAKLPTYSPLAGSVGEASTTSVTFSNYGQTGITRAAA